jgi:hypothetical protein
MRPASTYFNTINVYTFDANSVYHGGTVTVKKEFSKSLSFRANYTFSKGIDDASGFNYSGNGGQQAAQNSFDLGAERGRSETDRRHNFSANLIYQTPFHNLLLRGWQVSGTGRAYSGAPFTVLQKGTADQGEPTRPDRVCNGKLDNPTVKTWFDTSCFVVVPTNAYRFGNSGRDILDGPGYLEVDTGISRNFHLSERSRLQFRWEVFNILNHPNLKMPSGSWNDITSKSVGAITSSADPRVMQFAAKYVF